MGLFGPPNIKSLVAKRKVEALIKALNYDKDDEIIVAAAEALGQMMDSRAVDPLIQVIKDKNVDHIRKACFAALIQIGEPSWESIISLLDTTDIYKESYIDWALKPIGYPAVELLISKLNSSSNQIKIINILGTLKDPKAVEPLISILVKSYEEIALNTSNLTMEQRENLKVEAAWALGEIGNKRALNALIIALQDQNYEVRFRAAVALGEIGDPQAINPLLTHYSDENPFVRSKVAEALYRLGWEPDNIEDKVRFWASNYESVGEKFELVQKCAKLGKSAVDVLISVLEDKNSSYSEKDFASDSLKEMGIPSLRQLVKENMQLGFLLLQEIGWKPSKDETSAIWWVFFRERWDKCVEIGEIAVPSMLKWFYDSGYLLWKRLEIIPALEKIGGAYVEENLKKIADPSEVNKWMKLWNIENMEFEEILRLPELDEESVLSIISALEKIRCVEIKKSAMKMYSEFLEKAADKHNKEWSGEERFIRDLGEAVVPVLDSKTKEALGSLHRLRVRIVQALENVTD